MEKTSEDLQAAVNQIQNAVIQCSDQMIKSLAYQSGYGSTASYWVEYANQLHRLVPDYARPSWLDDACREFGGSFNAREGHGEMLSRFVTSRAPEIRVPIEVGEGALLDVESLFESQYEFFDLNTVFEGLVKRLEELIAADIIDNRTVHEALTRLNALFRKSKRGTFATVMMTMNFGRFFLNSFGGVLKANKYAKSIVENFEIEFTEAAETVQRAEEATKREMVAKLTNQARLELFLESHPDLRPTVSGYLPAPESNEEPDDE